VGSRAWAMCVLKTWAMLCVNRMAARCDWSRERLRSLLVRNVLCEGIVSVDAYARCPRKVLRAVNRYLLTRRLMGCRSYMRFFVFSFDL
jgi:hypothetical protein